MPNHDPRTTLAVLRATPGMRSSSSMVCGDLAAELSVTTAAGALDGLGLVAEEAGGADELFELRQGSAAMAGRGEGLEERRRDHVDAHVGALGGEDGGHQQFPRGAVVEGALGVGVGFVQAFEDGGDAVRGQGIDGLAGLRFGAADSSPLTC